MIAARPIRRIPLAYVVVAVTVYCATIWAAAIVGIGAGAHALFPAAKSFADSALRTTPAAAEQPD